MTFNELLQEFGTLAELGEIELIEGIAFFEIDDLLVMMRHDESGDRLVINTDVFQLTSLKIADISDILLELNLSFAFNGGQAVAFDRKAREIQLIVSLPLSQLSVKRLEVELAVFVKRANSLRATMQLMESEHNADEIAEQAGSDSITFRG